MILYWAITTEAFLYHQHASDLHYQCDVYVAETGGHQGHVPTTAAAPTSRANTVTILILLDLVFLVSQEKNGCD
jgi:hypothetical protein